MENAAQNRSCGCPAWSWGANSRVALIAALFTFCVDQFQKWWMILVVGMQEHERFRVLPFFDIVFIKNTGISYSLFDNKSFGWQLALAVFAVLVAGALWIWAARQSKNFVIALSLGLIIGGALGNALDRVLLGGVADFFLLHAYGRSWYVFNIADVAIVAGVIGLLYDLLVLSRNDAAKPS